MTELPDDVAAAIAHIDDLVKRFEEHPDSVVQERVFELLTSIDTVHRAGLTRLNELLKVAGLQRRAVEDPEIRLLLDLYDLGEGGQHARAEAVLESIRPSVEAAGATIDLLGVEPDHGSVRVRLSPGPGEDLAQHWDALRTAVEHAIRDGMPDVRSVEILDENRPPVVPANFVPLSRLITPRALAFEPVLALESLPPDHLRAVDVGSVRVLLARGGTDEVFAYRNACPGSPFPLDAATVQNGALICPWHGCRFDLRGGRRLDASAPGLGVLSVRVANGQILVAIPEPAAA